MTAASIVSALSALDANCEIRTLKLRTLRTGPAGLVDLIKDHVQGFTRVDHGSRSTIVVSISGEDRGELWFADFARELDPKHPGRCPRLAKTGDVVATANPATKHPGGLQGSGSFVAVPCEADAGWARIEIYDITDVRTPQLADSFVLDNSLKEGVTQLTRSKAGWLGFAPLDAQDHLLFVGGPKFGELNGWFYRYSPGALAGRRFAFAGNFAGKPRSTSHDAWGPQSNVAFVRTPQGAPTLITFGAEGANGRKALRSKIRCFSLDMANPAACGLVHELQAAPKSFDLDKADIDDFFGANARWGSSAFLDPGGPLQAAKLVPFPAAVRCAGRPRYLPAHPENSAETTQGALARSLLRIATSRRRGARASCIAPEESSCGLGSSAVPNATNSRIARWPSGQGTSSSFTRAS